jgi:hypothetical protein
LLEHFVEGALVQFADLAGGFHRGFGGFFEHIDHLLLHGVSPVGQVKKSVQFVQCTNDAVHNIESEPDLSTTHTKYFSKFSAFVAGVFRIA